MSSARAFCPRSGTFLPIHRVEAPSFLDEIPASGRLRVLSGAAPALWLVFGLKLVAILAYGIMNSTLVL